MKKLLISALLGAVTMSALSGCYVADPPPGAYYVRGPRVWVPAHYQWNGYARVRVPGHWRRA
jgi:hypothetical protein